MLNFAKLCNALVGFYMLVYLCTGNLAIAANEAGETLQFRQVPTVASDIWWRVVIICAVMAVLIIVLWLWRRKLIGQALIGKGITRSSNPQINVQAVRRIGRSRVVWLALLEGDAHADNAQQVVIVEGPQGLAIESLPKQSVISTKPDA